MHELSIALALVDEVEQIRARERASNVCGISVSLGELCGVEREALEFCFPFAAEGTCVERAKLIINEVKTEVLCAECGQRSNPEMPCIICAGCGSSNVRITGGCDFIISSVELEQDE